MEERMEARMKERMREEDGGRRMGGGGRGFQSMDVGRAAEDRMRKKREGGRGLLLFL